MHPVYESHRTKERWWIGSILLRALTVFVCLKGPASAELRLDAYHQFLAENADLTAAGIMQDYGGDIFLSRAPADLADVAYMEQIDRHYQLTADEKALLEQHSFVVTERVQPYA